MDLYEHWIKRLTDQAHAEDWGGKHRSGFCEACADAYLVLNHAVADYRGAVKALRPFVAAFDGQGREFCPEFNGPRDLAAFEAAARVVDRAGGQ